MRKSRQGGCITPCNADSALSAFEIHSVCSVSVDGSLCPILREELLPLLSTFPHLDLSQVGS